mmetsp:Transcript_8790/g.22130  ORF Transcript_8790/g.22130 Transcript_8790/m.22130 type:complete len:1260 (+) Transcript_8790:32-3811(+)
MPNVARRVGPAGSEQRPATAAAESAGDDYEDELSEEVDPTRFTRIPTPELKEGAIVELQGLEDDKEPKNGLVGRVTDRVGSASSSRWKVDVDGEGFGTYDAENLLPLTAWEWDVRILLKQGCEKGAKIASPVFSLGGVDGLLLDFYPLGKCTSEDGQCSLFLRGPPDILVEARLWVDSVQRSFGAHCIGEAWGWANFTDAGPSSIQRIRVEIGSVASNPRVWKWDISQVKFSGANKKITSEKFGLCGVEGLHLDFYPVGDSRASEGQCSVYLGGPPTALLDVRIWVDETKRVFEGKCLGEGWGWADFALAQDTYSAIFVEVLSVSRNDKVWSWDISGLDQDLPRDEKLTSQEFSLMAIPRLRVDFYPRGAATSEDDHCSLFLRGPPNVRVDARLWLDEKKGTMRACSLAEGHGWPDFMPCATCKTIHVEILQVFPDPEVWGWDLSSVAWQQCEKGQCVLSAKFDVSDLEEIQVKFFPRGDLDSRDCCSIYLVGPSKAVASGRIWVDEVFREFSHQPVHGAGFSEFWELQDSYDFIYVEILKVIKDAKTKQQAHLRRKLELKRPQAKEVEPKIVDAEAEALAQRAARELEEEEMREKEGMSKKKKKKKKGKDAAEKEPEKRQDTKTTSRNGLGEGSDGDGLAVGADRAEASAPSASPQTEPKSGKAKAANSKKKVEAKPESPVKPAAQTAPPPGPPPQAPAGLQQSLGGGGATAKALQAELKQKNAQLQQRDAQIAEKEKLLQLLNDDKMQLRAEMRSKDKRLAELENQRKAEREADRKARAELEDKLKKALQTGGARKERIATLEDIVAQQTTSVADAKVEKNQDLAARNAVVASRDAKIRDLQQLVTSLSTARDEATAEVVAKGNEIADLRSQLEAERSTMNLTEKMLQAQTEVVQSSESPSLRERVAFLEAQLVQRDQKIRELADGASAGFRPSQRPQAGSPIGRSADSRAQLQSPLSTGARRLSAFGAPGEANGVSASMSVEVADPGSAKGHTRADGPVLGASPKMQAQSQDRSSGSSSRMVGAFGHVPEWLFDKIVRSAARAGTAQLRSFPEDVVKDIVNFQHPQSTTLGALTDTQRVRLQDFVEKVLEVHRGRSTVASGPRSRPPSVAPPAPSAGSEEWHCVMHNWNPVSDDTAYAAVAYGQRARIIVTEAGWHYAEIASADGSTVKGWIPPYVLQQDTPAFENAGKWVEVRCDWKPPYANDSAFVSVLAGQKAQVKRLDGGWAYVEVRDTSGEPVGTGWVPPVIIGMEAPPPG